MGVSSLEEYFNNFRKNIIGMDIDFSGPYGKKKIVYADWTASGRLYKPIEDKLQKDFGPFVANTHTETSVTGAIMTHSYHQAQSIIKQHVNAQNDIIISAGSGVTRQINKFQRLLGLKVPEKLVQYMRIPEENRPVVFVSHMEHHSNHTSWMETIADVICIKPNDQGLVNLRSFHELLEKYKQRNLKILAITAGSNVTGIQPPYHEMAKMIHQYNGLCFVDFACAAPYVHINMHPANPEEKLDAIYFSPHKFLGGPGSSGILIFNSVLYTNKIPDNPGGGTVKWTNPWGEYRYFDDIEEREDGGTPAFLQTIKAALCIKLKEQMGVDNILEREHEQLKRIFETLTEIKGLHILAENITNRLGVISFYFDDIHYNLVSKLLNDRFGIQVRGGCSCAGTYGHYLLHVNKKVSHSITNKIDHGMMDAKPGWVRLSIHPTTTSSEIEHIISSLKKISANHRKWSNEYSYNTHTNEYVFKGDTKNSIHERVNKWFELENL